jgi:hypothetical protein
MQVVGTIPELDEDEDADDKGLQRVRSVSSERSSSGAGEGASGGNRASVIGRLQDVRIVASYCLRIYFVDMNLSKILGSTNS